MRTVAHYMLALGMLITGSVNTLTTKLADKQRSEGVKGDRHFFTHPFFQVISRIDKEENQSVKKLEKRKGD